MDNLTTARPEKSTERLRRKEINDTVRSASFDGQFICVVTSGYLCLILSTDLATLSSFALDHTESFVHVFTKSRGLVRGGRDKLVFTAFDEWTPKRSHIVSTKFRESTNRISAMSTREDLIFAGTEEGEVGGWNYNGTKLYHIPKISECIANISVRQGRILVSSEFINRFRLPPQNGTRTQYPVLEKTEEVDNLFWATYDLRGERIYYETGEDNNRRVPVVYYRPLQPLDSSKIRLLGRNISSGEVVVRSLNGDKMITHSLTVPEGTIRIMWCYREWLFMIYKGGQEILQINLINDMLNDYEGTSKELAECFSLDHPEGPFHWLTTN